MIHHFSCKSILPVRNVAIFHNFRINLVNVVYCLNSCDTEICWICSHFMNLQGFQCILFIVSECEGKVCAHTSVCKSWNAILCCVQFLGVLRVGNGVPCPVTSLLIFKVTINRFPHQKYVGYPILITFSAPPRPAGGYKLWMPLFCNIPISPV